MYLQCTQYRLQNYYINLLNALYTYIYQIGYWYQPISTALYRLPENWLNLVCISALLVMILTFNKNIL